MNKKLRWIKKHRRDIAHFYWGVASVIIVIIWPDNIPSLIAKINAILGVVLSAYGYTKESVLNKEVARDEKRVH